MPSTRSFSLSLLLPALALSVPTNTASCTYNALGVGTFTHHAIYSFDGHALPAGLRPNTDTVGGAPFTRIYDPSLLTFSDGYVNLRVPGGQRSSPIRGAGINTVAGNILYASVRTNAIFSRVPGTVQSSFHKSRTGEIDLEFLTDPASTTNTGGVPSLHYTNHGAAVTTADGIDPGHGPREYRVDWIPGATRFYVDGALQVQFTENVPNMPGIWIWNNWSNGDMGFSGGPPHEDSVMRVSRIEIYYNTTGGMC